MRDDYRPEFDSFKALLLELAQIRSVDKLLKVVVTRLAERPHVALARVWLLDAADQCETCRLRLECADQKNCLHLKASAGQPKGSGNWSRCDGEFRRIPIGVGKVGEIARNAQPCIVQDTVDNYPKFKRPEWVRSEAIRGFNGQPICFQGKVLGALAVFTRIPTPDQAPDWLRILADYIAVALVSTQAFEEIDQLRAGLELENSYLREEVREAKAFGDIIGQSEAVRDLVRQIEKVAPTDASVLILGESGTGKELVAREIHDAAVGRIGL